VIAPKLPRDDRELFAGSLVDDADVQQRLRERLAVAAAQRGLLDVAYRLLDTPVGTLLIAATERGLVRVGFAGEDEDQILQQLARQVSPRILLAPARLERAARELDDYFAQRRKRFDLPLDLRLSHGFRRRVLGQMRDVQYGTTASYAKLAAAVDNPRAVRAVGSACATNPLPVVIPCHRIVHSDGTVGSYAGGADVKEALLRLERAA
jgi:methylated-DNA-[protein]-cysteine S-methyltransferase